LLAPLCANGMLPLADLVQHELETTMRSVPLEYRAEQWIHENRGRRWTMMGIVSDRHFYGDGCLFYDYDVRDACFAIPPRHRRGHRAYIMVMNRLLPHIASIDYGNTGLPATTPAWKVAAVKAGRKARDRLSFGKRQRFVPTTGTDFNGWARTSLREFYGELIRSESLRGRAFWDGKGIGALFDAHLRGEINCGHELGLVATAELFQRRWIDGR